MCLEVERRMRICRSANWEARDDVFDWDDLQEVSQSIPCMLR